MDPSEPMMNASDTKEDQLLIFRGAIYELSSVTIPVSLLVISHSTVIFFDYLKDRAKFVPCLFMGIALSDILAAQGQLVLSVLSILVYNGMVGERVLYRSLYYYMATALPGYTCSRLYNVILSLTLTVHVVDPFRHLNSPRLKTAVLIFSATLAFLHLSDVALFNIADMKYDIETVLTTPYLDLVKWFDIPGGFTAALLFCAPTHGAVEESRCYNQGLQLNGYTVLVALLLNHILPPLLILVCMIIQVVHLRQALSDSTSPLASTSRRACVTIVLVSLTFFVCHSAYILTGIVFSLIYRYLNTLPSAITQGNILGFTVFLLPLINSAVYPLILIIRKPELRQRYRDLYRRARSC